MIRSLYRSSKGGFTTDVPTTHWRVALRDAGGLLWLDFGEENPATLEPLLRDIFNFHPLAIDDALRETHIPKIDNWGEYAYAVLHGVAFDREALELRVREVDVFLGQNFMVTHHRYPVEVLDRLWSNCRSDQRRLERGPDFLLYDLLDMLTAGYMPVIDEMDDTIDEIETEVFGSPSQRTLSTLFTVKRVALHMRRIISPMREVLNRLARDDYAMIDPQDRVYFRDVYDHLVRLADVNESMRDLISGSLDTYLSVTSNRINQVMKVLTVISALFMPISFLAGFFGMNFGAIPFNNVGLLLAAVLMMIVVPAGMLFWFRRQGWL